MMILLLLNEISKGGFLFEMQFPREEMMKTKSAFWRVQNYKNERRKLVVAFSMNGLQSGAISRLRETTLLSVITTIATTPQPSGRLTFF